MCFGWWDSDGERGLDGRFEEIARSLGSLREQARKYKWPLLFKEASAFCHRSLSSFPSAVPAALRRCTEPLCGRFIPLPLLAAPDWSRSCACNDTLPRLRCHSMAPAHDSCQPANRQLEVASPTTMTSSLHSTPPKTSRHQAPNSRHPRPRPPWRRKCISTATYWLY